MDLDMLESRVERLENMIWALAGHVQDAPTQAVELLQADYGEATPAPDDGWYRCSCEFGVSTFYWDVDAWFVNEGGFKASGVNIKPLHAKPLVPRDELEKWKEEANEAVEMRAKAMVSLNAWRTQAQSTEAELAKVRKELTEAIEARNQAEVALDVRRDEHEALRKCRAELAELREDKGDDYSRGYFDGETNAEEEAVGKAKEEARAAWRAGIAWACGTEDGDKLAHFDDEAWRSYWFHRQGSEKQMRDMARAAAMAGSYCDPVHCGGAKLPTVEEARQRLEICTRAVWGNSRSHAIEERNKPVRCDRAGCENGDSSSLIAHLRFVDLPCKWIDGNDVVKWPHCSVCGIIRRRDGKNKPCRGIPAKVGLR